MKSLLYLILKNTNTAYETLEHVKDAGFNGTIINTDSVRRAVLDFPEEHHFFSLRDFEKERHDESVLCIFVVDNDKLEELKSIIRQYTDQFNKIKGGMFSRPLDDYEGSL